MSSKITILSIAVASGFCKIHGAKPGDDIYRKLVNGKGNHLL
jgi:hypothetical protein